MMGFAEICIGLMALAIAFAALSCGINEVSAWWERRRRRKLFLLYCGKGKTWDGKGIPPGIRRSEFQGSDLWRVGRPS